MNIIEPYEQLVNQLLDLLICKPIIQNYVIIKTKFNIM